MRTLLAAGFVLALTSLGAAAQVSPPPQLYPCEGTVGTVAAQIAFPGASYSGSTPPTAPTVYVLIQNTSTNDEWINPTVGGTATQAAPSYHLAPQAGYVFTTTDPIPQAISIIASGSSSAYTCWYR